MIDFEIITSDIHSELTAEIEQLLLQIFGSFDYDVIRLIKNGYDGQLKKLTVLGRDSGKLVAAAFAMWSVEDKKFAIFGPLGVDDRYRCRGIGTELMAMMIDYLKKIGIGAVYLGVKENHPAVLLYERLGFKRYNGVVMRRVFNLAVVDRAFKCDGNVKIVPARWRHWPAVQVLISLPRYGRCYRFTSVFYQMMIKCQYLGVKLAVLVAETGNIVGVLSYFGLAEEKSAKISDLLKTI